MLVLRNYVGPAAETVSSTPGVSVQPQRGRLSSSPPLADESLTSAMPQVRDPHGQDQPADRSEEEQRLWHQQALADLVDLVRSEDQLSFPIFVCICCQNG